jgi:RNA polymerase sigma-70 factor, ECF subfamily
MTQFWIALCSLTGREATMNTHPATSEVNLDGNDLDVELMLRAQAGDDAAFSELFERYSKRLVTYAHRIVRDRWRAEELVQDAFLQIYRARDRYSPCARFSTYIYRVVTNNCLNALRRVEHEKKAPEETQALLADDTIPQPDNLVGDRELVQQIAEMVRDLPSKQRIALVLSRLEGLEHHEVASCLGVTEFAVKSLVFRATRTLREGTDRATQPGLRRPVRGAPRPKHRAVATRRPTASWSAAAKLSAAGAH